MCPRPIIGINGGGLFGERLPRYECETNLPRWIRCTSASGGIPIVAPPVSIDNGIDELLDAVQGFVVVGDRDAFVPMPNDADELLLAPLPEMQLVQAIVDRRVPFLGIGLGFQLLNIVLGGSIAGLERDARGQPFHVYPHNPRHALDATPGSVIDSICGDRTVLVTSTHYFAVDRIAEGLNATAVTCDGVVEAFEWASEDWFAMGVQFQPATDGSIDLAASIFDVFLDEVIAHAASLSAHTVEDMGGSVDFRGKRR